jgi:rare lipoprotein A
MDTVNFAAVRPPPIAVEFAPPHLLASLLSRLPSEFNMLPRFLTSVMVVLVLGTSHATAAPDLDENNVAASAPLESPAVQPDETVAQAASPVEQAAAAVAHTFQGIVSYYGREFAGRKTANGERFDPSVLTMAHKTLAFGTLVRVTNLYNNRSVVVRVNDRGPFVGSRVADLSAGAANLLGMLGAGVVQARLEVLGTALSKAFK